MGMIRYMAEGIEMPISERITQGNLVLHLNEFPASFDDRNNPLLEPGNSLLLTQSLIHLPMRVESNYEQESLSILSSPL